VIDRKGGGSTATRNGAIGVAYSGLICTLRNFTTPLPH
jgi:hypothetical protein